jgi:hypothetical protein
MAAFRFHPQVKPGWPDGRAFRSTVGVGVLPRIHLILILILLILLFGGGGYYMGPGVGYYGGGGLSLVLAWW